MILAVFLSFIVYSFAMQKTISSPIGQKKIISYEILRSWVPGRPTSGRFKDAAYPIPGREPVGMEILVSPNSTKEEVLDLAKDLVARYRMRDMFIAMIYDSKEAWANRFNDNYPEEKLYLHLLVNIMLPLNTSNISQEILWRAEKRIDPKR
jgi:hypothetical protein